MLIRRKIKARQRGASAVEFGIIAILFFTLFFGILEFGRFFYLFNTVQEVTRCAARAAVVKLKDDWYKEDSTSVPPIISIPQQCLFDSDELIVGWEIKKANVRLRALNLASLNLPYGDPGGVADPDSIGENISNCVTNPAGTDCIRFVEASVEECGGDESEDCQLIQYQPIFGLIPQLSVNIPSSTVTMPAESLGYTM